MAGGSQNSEGDGVHTDHGLGGSGGSGESALGLGSGGVGVGRQALRTERVRNRSVVGVEKLRRAWTKAEDAALVKLVQKMGAGTWNRIAAAFNELNVDGFPRDAKACR